MDTQKTGEFIRELRKEKNMTQVELAEKLSCTDKAVSRWETGKGLPDADMLLSLSSVFEISINELLLGERFEFSKTENENPSSVEDNQKIKEIISSTDETIVDILKDKEKEISKINVSVIMLMAACCIQIFIQFILPHILKIIVPTVEALNFYIYGTLLNFIFVGLIKDKSRWLFPIFATVYPLAYLLIDQSEAHIFIWISPTLGLVSAAVIAVITGIRHLTDIILKKRKAL